MKFLLLALLVVVMVSADHAPKGGPVGISGPNSGVKEVERRWWWWLLGKRAQNEGVTGGPSGGPSGIPSGGPSGSPSGSQSGVKEVERRAWWWWLIGKRAQNEGVTGGPSGGPSSGPYGSHSGVKEVERRAWWWWLIGKRTQNEGVTGGPFGGPSDIPSGGPYSGPSGSTSGSHSGVKEVERRAWWWWLLGKRAQNEGMTGGPSGRLSGAPHGGPSGILSGAHNGVQQVGLDWLTEQASMQQTPTKRAEGCPADYCHNGGECILLEETNMNGRNYLCACNGDFGGYRCGVATPCDTCPEALGAVYCVRSAIESTGRYCYDKDYNLIDEAGMTPDMQKRWAWWWLLGKRTQNEEA